MGRADGGPTKAKPQVPYQVEESRQQSGKMSGESRMAGWRGHGRDAFEGKASGGVAEDRRRDSETRMVATGKARRLVAGGAVEVEGTPPLVVETVYVMFSMCQAWCSLIDRKRRKQDENASGNLNHGKAR